MTTDEVPREDRMSGESMSHFTCQGSGFGWIIGGLWCRDPGIGLLCDSRWFSGIQTIPSDKLAAAV
jgi:hypothetical protein